MKTQQHVVKVSSQGQITLPRELRDSLRLTPGARITLTFEGKTQLRVDNKLPIEQYYGTFGRSITGGQDAVDYVRELRRVAHKQLDEKHSL